MRLGVAVIVRTHHHGLSRVNRARHVDDHITTKGLRPFPLKPGNRNVLIENPEGQPVKVGLHLMQPTRRELVAAVDMRRLVGVGPTDSSPVGIGERVKLIYHIPTLTAGKVCRPCRISPNLRSLNQWPCREKSG